TFKRGHTSQYQHTVQISSLLPISVCKPSTKEMERVLKSVEAKPALQRSLKSSPGADLGERNSVLTQLQLEQKQLPNLTGHSPGNIWRLTWHG
ncbi:hypothetical protein RJ639_034156, partial [Escallonia herrerae]